jgi:hypothetical protein
MSDPRWFALLCFVASVSGLFLAHVALCRQVLAVRENVSRQKATALLGLALNVPLVAAVLFGGVQGPWPPADTMWLLVYLLLAYNAVAYAYFHLFNLGETGRRIRMLLEVADGTAPSADASYSAESMVRARLQRLEQMGQARRIGARWHLHGTLLLRIGKFVRAVGVLTTGPRHSR